MADEPKTCGALCGGVNTQYWARGRYNGRRKYDVIGKPTRSYPTAVRRMTEAFIKSRFDRLDVVMTADYYDPVMLCELVRMEG